MAQTEQVAALAPSFAGVLPYNGYGGVAILDDGILFVTVGGEVRGPHFDPADSATYEGQLDTAGLSLVEYGNEVFLDKNGVQMAAHRLVPRQVTSQAFADAGRLGAHVPRYALIDLRGDLSLEYDPTTGDLTITVTETEGAGQKLDFAVRVVAASAGDAQAADHPEFGPGVGPSGSNGTVLLSQPNEVSSSCTVSCRNGSCEITCDNKGCRAYCSAGQPICLCTDKIQA